MNRGGRARWALKIKAQGGLGVTLFGYSRWSKADRAVVRESEEGSMEGGNWGVYILGGRCMGVGVKVCVVARCVGDT